MTKDKAVPDHIFLDLILMEVVVTNGQQVGRPAPMGEFGAKANVGQLFVGLWAALNFF